MDRYIIFADGKSPHTLKWIKELQKYFDIYLISLNGYSENILESISKEKIYVLNESVEEAGGNYQLLLKYSGLKKIVNAIKPKYLNAHYISSYGFLAALLKKANPEIKLIQSAWGSDILVTPFENIVKKKISSFALKYADVVTSDSYNMSDTIRSIYPCKHIITFAFGLDALPDEMEIVKDDTLIFSNRALTKNYNIDKIIEWFASLEDDGLRLIIANDGQQRQKLEQLVKEFSLSHRIEFVGFLSQKEQNELYKKAKYYISIPSSDSTAVSLLEAMSYGCYPIVSNLPANREWIIDNFNGSFFYEGMSLDEISSDVVQYNRKIIETNAIFSKSIKKFVKEIQKI